MAQLLNRLRAEERIAGVEFWHSPERCGWLMKQGTGRRDKSAAESERRFALNEVLDFGASDATSRGNGDGGFGLPRPWRSSSRPRMRGPRARRSLRARGLRVLTTSLSLGLLSFRGIHQDVEAQVVHTQAREDILVQDRGSWAGKLGSAAPLPRCSSRSTLLTVPTLSDFHSQRRRRHQQVLVHQGRGGRHKQGARL